jgi:hypothetical protein
MISTGAVGRREQARQGDGKFGVQPQDRPPVDETPTVGSDSWIARQATRFCDNLHRIVWDYPDGTVPAELSRSYIADAVQEDAYNDDGEWLEDDEARLMSDKVMQATHGRVFPSGGANRAYDQRVTSFDGNLCMTPVGRCVCCGRNSFDINRQPFTNQDGLCSNCASWPDTMPLPNHVTYTDQTGLEYGMSPTLPLSQDRVWVTADGATDYGESVLNAIQHVNSDIALNDPDNRKILVRDVADALRIAEHDTRWEEVSDELLTAVGLRVAERESDVEEMNRDWSEADGKWEQNLRAEALAQTERKVKATMSHPTDAYEALVVDAVGKMRGIKVEDGLIVRTDLPG